jgi:hypothetical protein
VTTSRAIERLPRPLNSVFVWTFAERWLLPAWFAVCTFTAINSRMSQSITLIGIDARIYYRAAQSFLAGGNPWSAQVDDISFAAPPPTLIPYLPMTILPEDVFVVLAMAGCALVAVALVRICKLPWFWLLFTPLVESVWVGNPNGLVVLLLLRGLTGGAVLAVFLKVYAIVPLIGEMRLRTVALSLVCLALTLPVLPWGLYQAQSAQLTATLVEQSQGGHSALSLPILIPFAVLALLSLDLRTAGWLAVPALWPATQMHYSLLAFPVMHPILGVLFCFTTPGGQAIAIIAFAAWVYLGGGPARTPTWKVVADRLRQRPLLARRRPSLESDERLQIRADQSSAHAPDRSR